jgi:hypothetical protein
MVFEATKIWLDSIQLPADASVLAGLALRLAQSFDDDGHTSTAAELRKTVLEIKRLAGDQTAVVDPIAEILTR